ncbi:hypothetical protein BELL_0060g00030 [Botrytis elliptica]|uniref:Uncharacterized protein n=1 Tax=Botrytis elliptica TaxID=278938 RepID=A0A4Z1JXL2_9HELO|nr:hypothetical protein BELL_0060g00030 [Botrytis elliptica]
MTIAQIQRCMQSLRAHNQTEVLTGAGCTKEVAAYPEPESVTDLFGRFVTFLFSNQKVRAIHARQCKFGM